MGGAGMIKLEQVSKRFDGKQVLHCLNWQMEKGECWKIAGASGVGKTTLLRLLMGLETPDSGRITGADKIRFCPVFQEDRLADTWSAVQNVALVCRGAAQAREVLGALLPSDSLEQPVRTLSGGMRRRVALARALAAEGDVLLLDEPFAGLDERTVDRACRAIEKYRAGRAALLVSHGTEELFSAWKVLRLDDGSGIL